MFAPEEYLDRIASKLRSEIGPAITDDYARTQAFMASVILERVSRQITAGFDSEQTELDEMRLRLAPQIGDDPELSALSAVATDDTGLSLLVESMYQARDRLGQDRFDQALGEVRTTLRLRLDRSLMIAEGKAS